MSTWQSAGLIGLAVVVLASSGCSGSSRPSSSFCAPQLNVEPVHPQAGQTITVSTSDKCVVDAPVGGWVVIAAPIGSGASGASRMRVTTTDDFDGGFNVELTLPSDFPLGDAFVAIENWDYSPCDVSGSCASASGDFTVLP